MIRNKLGTYHRQIKIGRVSPGSGIFLRAWEFTLLEGEYKDRKVYVLDVIGTVRKVRK